MDVDSLLAPGGALSVDDPAYEDRPAQRRMAEAVAEALEGGGSLVVEAGTGVGKSLAYLLPAALWAASAGRRVVVSTHTRALQEQILNKDLPMAARSLRRLGHTLRFAMLQGADNYLCVQRLARARDGVVGLFPGGSSALLDRLAQWSRTASTGHRAALPELVPQALWSRISRDPELCLGPNGRLWSACLYRKDKDHAERSHLLVVNHALLLSGARLPSFDALVIDEAHTLEEAAAAHFGVAVSRASVSRLLEDARALARRFPELACAVQRCADAPAVFEVAALAHGLSPRGEEAASRPLDPEQLPDHPPGLLELEAACWRIVETSQAAAPAMDVEAEAAWQGELRLLHSRLCALRNDWSGFRAEGGEDTARWIEASASSVEIRAVPLDVGGRLSEALFSRGVPVVLTSATLSSHGGLRAFKLRLGLETARELVLDSPFDYASQAALLLLDDLPDPSDDRAYLSAVAARCVKIVSAVPGGVFILFSSWKSLRAVHARLKRRVKERPLWVQGEAGNDVLREQFAQAGNAVLLGVDTFWQGVDVPGEALSCVVLVKLPFPQYGSPIEEARKRWYESLGREYFRDYSLPRAVMKFRQGFGRLIRTSTDRGAVVVLDSRIVRRGYGAAFLEALPRCRRLEALDDLAAFFNRQAG